MDNNTGKVQWIFTMTLDGFVAGPDHNMDWMAGLSEVPGLEEAYMEATGAVLAGRDGYDSAIGDSRPWSSDWKGAVFILTHHPEDARPASDITFLSCPVAEAVQIGLAAADGKNLAVFSPNIGRQLLELGLIDEIDIHVVPVLLGDGIRLYSNPGKPPITLHRLDDSDPRSSVRVRYRPAYEPAG